MNTKTMCIMFSVIVAAGCLQAQALRGPLTANVPFGFVAHESTFPAGEYQIYRLNNHVIMVDGGKGQKKGAMPTVRRTEEKNRGTAKLIFHRYGESYFLAEVWDSTENGYALPKSRTEKDTALIAARQASRVTLAASVGR